MNFKMEKWFENIKRKYLIHVILGGILVFSLTFVPQDSSINAIINRDGTITFNFIVGKYIKI